VYRQRQTRAELRAQRLLCSFDGKMVVGFAVFESASLPAAQDAGFSAS
jgi:hypothetical protein